MLATQVVRTGVVFVISVGLASAQWVQKAPATSPTARVGCAMDYVPLNGGLVMFGGIGGVTLSNQTWTYDGIDWTLLTPATSPTGRFGGQLVYDTARGVAVHYGGLASAISIANPTNHTWEWNGTTWTQIIPTANAGNRYYYGACYDSGRARVVMFGGANSQLLGSQNNQTWEYEGTTWTQITTVGNPGARARPAMCFHPGLGKAVVFGGDNPGGLLDDTWLYDGVAGTWTQVVIPGAKPSARNAATMVYDPVRNLCVLTGGQDANGVMSDTWTFDGTTWTQQPVTTQGVRDHAMAFLPNTKNAVKFGGFVAAPSTLSNQTWEIGTGIFGTGCAGPNGVPALAAATAPLLGQPWSLNVTNMNPAFNYAILGFGFTPLPGIDLGFIDMPGCSAFTTLDIMITITGAAGAANWTWATVTGLVGDSFFAQAYCFDPTATTLGFTVSNAAYATINF